ncbi:AMP-binding protein [Tepidimonas taiwanensis]|uniref:Acetyl-coenzyme A synthetase n=1 Tax=Tepidimonas taiwanensis TaxID=307486 RepID=A0A554XD06_9BURK|nr:AMP-binding protein [Tepidimonas taiwanensis]TSE33713.1 Acetyl-coenzyme A synthetase [Tepidimonas taiwanensis]UBQ06739.1 AMP-binding protein [Tepidimonas taiwanensis]
MASQTRRVQDSPPVPADAYAALYHAFRWHVPPRFNIAHAGVRRWAVKKATAAAVAIIEDRPGRPRPRRYTYGELADEANRLSNALRLLGVQRGDRVAIVLPQRFETAVAYMAVLQLGAVAMPLSQLFGPEALEYRLQDSAASVALVDDATGPGVLAVRGRCPALRHVVGLTGAFDVDVVDWPGAREGLRSRFEAVDTAADDPAVLIYTSGTTGNPKGALIPHRALIGNLSGFVASQNWFGFDPWDARAQSEAVFWSPADWAWTGGLMDALLPTLYFGRPIVAWHGRFDPLEAFALLQRHRVTHTFLFPTALKAMMKAVPEPRRRYRLRLQAIMSAGEAVGDAVFAYCRDQLGVTVNEMFGQTEINYVVGNCARLWPARPGSMGRAYPGHRVAVIDEAGKPVPPGTVGEVAVHRRDVHGDPDPVFFLGYWGNEAATRGKFTGDPADSWCRTGDLAVQDADGYLWYQGRADDVFKSAGYRIGPSEIENCLVKHPAVANAAVVPKPDAERGAVVKAYVVLAPAWAERRERCADPATEFDAPLVAELQQHVRGQLAPYEYPKEIEFIDALPMTTTGKVQRRVLRLQEEARARAAGGPSSVP